MATALAKGTFALAAVLVLLGPAVLPHRMPARGAEPPALNPFAPVRRDRDDAVPGYVEMSDGTIHLGAVYLTRDERLTLYDETLERQREIPLRVVKQIECTVQKEWIEKEWRFKEMADDQKVYTGRAYPSRQYAHTVTLNDGRTITGPLSGIVFVRPYTLSPAGPRTGSPAAEPIRVLLHKRQKGKIGTDLASLHYVRLVKLGKESLEEGRRKAAALQSESPPVTSAKQ